MLKVDVARSYEEYAEGKAVTVTLPGMPRKGDYIILSDDAFKRLHKSGDTANLIVKSVFLIEEFDNPFVEVFPEIE